MIKIETVNKPFIKYVSKVIPLAFDESMSYYEVLCSLYSYLKDVVMPVINNNAEATEELQKLYVELKEYIDNYFENMDIQEEINNKLDDMAESGELTDIIAQYLNLAGILAYNTLDDLKNADNLANGSFTKTFGLNEYNDGYGAFYKIRTLTSGDVIDNVNIVAVNFSDTLIAEKVNDHYLNELLSLIDDSKAKLHFIALGDNNGESTAIEIKNNNILIDLGAEDSFNTLKSYLITNNITKFRYVIISHWDIDHSNTAPNFISLIENEDFDFSDCEFIFPHKDIDWNETVGLSGQKARFEAVRDYLIAHNYTIIYPNEEDIINIDYNNYLKFYNLKSEFFDDYYVLTDDAGNSQDYTNYNNFSMVCELNTNKKAILFTGDINYLAENNIVNEIEKIDLIKIPHHALNRYANQEFLNKCYNKVGIYTSNASTPVLRPYYQIFNKAGKLLSTIRNGNIIVTYFENELVYHYDNNLYAPNVAVLDTNTNLNDLLDEGTYMYNNTSGVTITNHPVGYTNQFILKVLQITSTVSYQFLYTLNVNPIIWIRKFATDSWTEWKQLYTNLYGVITANKTGSFSINSTSFIKFDLDNQLEKNPTCPMEISDGSIKVLKGVELVQVIANVMIDNVTAGDRLAIAIYKNNTVYQRIDTYAPSNNYNSFQLSTFMPVSENDKISLYVRNISGARGSISQLAYNTNVQVVTLH